MNISLLYDWATIKICSVCVRVAFCSHPLVGIANIRRNFSIMLKINDEFNGYMCKIWNECNIHLMYRQFVAHAHTHTQQREW